MSMNHDEYIDLSVDNIDDTEDIEFDTYNDEIRINPVLKTHLDDGDKLVWYKDPTIIATWHSNGRLDVPCFDATDVTISAVNFRILKGHWRTKDEHGVGTESNHWLYDDKPISEYLDLYPDFWKANEIKAVQPKKERKPRQKKETSDKTVNVILPRQEDIVKEYKYKSEKLLFDSNFSNTYSDLIKEQATPSWVVENMIDLLPDEVWRTDSKFLDIYCKSGIFLEIIIDRLMKKADYSSIGLTSDREIRQYIIENQVYAICWNKWYLDLSRKVINGKSSMIGNIYCIGSEVENMTEDEAKAVLESNKAQSSIDKTIQTINIRKEFFNNVKFDIVIGNPPYNNDIYLDFVEKSFELSSNITCMITPAKWQAKGGDKNEQFRKNIVPHMSKIVYYPDSCDIFDIAEHGGISYYILDKAIHNDKYIRNEMVIYTNCEVRTLNNNLWNIGNNIVTKVMNNKTLNIFYVHETKDCYKCTIGKKIIRSGSGHKDIKGKFTCDYSTLHNCIVLSDVGIENSNDENRLGDSVAIYYGSKEQCNYFRSYINSKFVRFLVLMSIHGVGIYDQETWRFVPDPGAFDRIFVDRTDPVKQPNAQPDKDGNYEYNGQKYCSLYKKYNLTEEEINIIESVIKERK